MRSLIWSSIASIDHAASSESGPNSMIQRFMASISLSIIWSIRCRSIVTANDARAAGGRSVIGRRSYEMHGKHGKHANQRGEDKR